MDIFPKFTGETGKLQKFTRYGPHAFAAMAMLSPVLAYELRKRTNKQEELAKKAQAAMDQMAMTPQQPPPGGAPPPGPPPTGPVGMPPGGDPNQMPVQPMPPPPPPQIAQPGPPAPPPEVSQQQAIGEGNPLSEAVAGMDKLRDVIHNAKVTRNQPNRPTMRFREGVM